MPVAAYLLLRLPPETPAWVVAAATDEPAAPWLTLVNFGVLGIVLYFTFFKPKIHTSSEVMHLREMIERERTGREKAEAEVARLHVLVEEGVIPALSRSTDLIARSMAERGRKP